MTTHRRFLAVLFVAGCWMGLQPAARAADPMVQAGVPTFGRPIGKSDDRIAEDVLPKAPRESLERLQRARLAIDRRQYGRAAAEIQGVLDRDDGFVEGIPLRTVRQEARRILAEMPPEGRQWHQVQFGNQAQALLDDAAARGDRPALARIADTWFPTEAAHQAAILLARDSLDRGRPREAIRRLEPLRESPAAMKYEPETSVLLAAAWLLAGSEEQAREALAGLKERSPGAKYRLGAREFNTSSGGAEAIAWLKQQSRAEPPGRSGPADRWTMFRGDAARNAQSEWNGPLREPGWGLKTIEDPQNLRLLQMVEERLHSDGVPRLPILHPIAAGNLLLARTPWRLLAIDLDTGRRMWEHPGARSLDKAGDPPDPPKRLGGIELQERVWEDAAYGQLACDGRRVFFIEPPDPHERPKPAGKPDPFAAFKEPAEVPNRLTALECGDRPRPAWTIGGPTGGDEPKLAGAFFLGAPLADEGRLYVMIEVKGVVSLVALEAATGRLEWSRAISQPRDGVLQDPVRRLAGATPSLADGVIVCPTSAGVVVAVDAASRSILWGFAYRRTDPLAPPKPEPEGEWIDATATIAEGRALVTPFDSDRLDCLDLLTGRQLWSSAGGRMLFVACVHGDKAVLVGLDAVTALRIVDGRPAWPRGPLSLADHGLPSGHGLYAGKFYYLPTAAKKILQIDLDSGRIAAEMKTPEILGNLIATGGRLFSQSAYRLEQFGAGR